jgi:hypothetical protein
MKNRVVVTEIYSRVSGYFRPINQWNKAKQEEFSDRRELKFDSEISPLKQSLQGRDRTVFK